MKNVEFSDTEKIQMFDQIAELYFNRNFGRATKADIELLMFKFYLEALIEQNKDLDNTINYNKCSDYLISKDLCITQQQVRNLKIKKHLKYPEEFNWQEALAKLLNNARLDDGKIIINIPDPNLYMEIENFMDERGCCLEKTFNRKMLKMSIEYFIELSIEIEKPENRKKMIKQIKEELKNHQKTEKDFDDKSVGKSLFEAGVNVTTILANISTIASPENYLLKKLISFVNNTFVKQ